MLGVLWEAEISYSSLESGRPGQEDRHVFLCVRDLYTNLHTCIHTITLILCYLLIKKIIFIIIIFICCNDYDLLLLTVFHSSLHANVHIHVQFILVFIPHYLLYLLV